MLAISELPQGCSAQLICFHCFPDSYRSTSSQTFSKATQTSSQCKYSPKPASESQSHNFNQMCKVHFQVLCGYHLIYCSLELVIIPSLQKQKLKHRGKLIQCPKGVKQGFARGHRTGSEAQSTLHHPVQPHGSAPIISHKLDCARATPGCSDPGHTWAAGPRCGD